MLQLIPSIAKNLATSACFMVMSNGQVVDMTSICQPDGAPSPSASPYSAPYESYAEQESASQSSGDFYVSSVTANRNTVYGTIHNTTSSTYRNIVVRVYADGWSESRTYSGIVAPGSKIEIPVVIRDFPSDRSIQNPSMSILDYTVD